MWQSLEEDIIPPLSNIRTNWLDLQSNSKKYKESNVCVAGGMKVTEFLRYQIMLYHMLVASYYLLITLLQHLSSNNQFSALGPYRSGVDRGHKTWYTYAPSHFVCQYL